MEKINNKAQLLYAKEDLRLEDLSIPNLGDRDVLINIKACGICKSDIDYYFNGRVADFIIKKPIVIGHEASGVILKVGGKVKNIKVGDRVSIIPLIGCKKCRFCLNNQENLCINRKFLGCPPDTQGCFQQFLAHPEDLVVKISDDISFEEAAMVEPSAIAYNAIKVTGGLQGTNNIGIIGAGNIGLLLGKILAINKKNYINFFDIDEKKLNFAKKIIKDSRTYLIQKDHKIFPNDLNLAFDVSGSPEGVNTAIENMDFGGRIGLIGWSAGSRNTNLNNVVLKELALLGSSNFRVEDFKEVTDLVNLGKLDFKGLYRSGFTINDLEDVFVDIKDRKFLEPKVIIKIEK